MRKLVLGLVVAALSAATFADETATFMGSWKIGDAAQGGVAADPTAYYSNIDNFSGSGYANGGAALSGVDGITRLVADKLTPAWSPGLATTWTKLTWEAANFNATAVSARMRIRFYDDNGAGGLPGTYITGYSFAPISLTAGSISGFFFNPNVLFSTVPALTGTFWYGITFDNNGAAATTLAQLNNLGVGLFNPPVKGSSADAFFQTTAAGSFVVNNPAGTEFLNPFGGAPVGNFGVELTPEPTTLLVLGLGSLFIARRRR